MPPAFGLLPPTNWIELNYSNGQATDTTQRRDGRDCDRLPGRATPDSGEEGNKGMGIILLLYYFRVEVSRSGR